MQALFRINSGAEYAKVAARGRCSVVEPMTWAKSTSPILAMLSVLVSNTLLALRSMCITYSKMVNIMNGIAAAGCQKITVQQQNTTKPMSVMSL